MVSMPWVDIHSSKPLSEHLGVDRSKKCRCLQNFTSVQKRYICQETLNICQETLNVMATESKVSKTSVKKSSASVQLGTKSNMKAGLGLFKDKIVSESSAWEDDLRVTIKK